MKPLDDVSEFAKRIVPEDQLMLVGHLPFMERMASYLVTGATEQPVFKFQNSGIVCLNKDPQGQSWVIIWALMPKIG